MPLAPVAGYAGEQLRNAATIMAATTGYGLDRQAQVIAVACAMGESSLRNIGYGDYETGGVLNPDGTPTSSLGLFQQQKWWGTVHERLSPVFATRAFLSRLVKVSGWRDMSPSLAIHRVQINADPNHYTRYVSPATRVVDALTEYEKGGDIVARPSLPIPQSSTVDIGYGRGRLAPNPAASIRRIDAQLGRPADVNDAWRSPEQADKNALAWALYQKGMGPIAPYALGRYESIHCRGYATDSDDWYNPAAARVWRDNGWRQTARYPDSRDEPWHGEYDEALDKFLGQAAGSGETAFEEGIVGAGEVAQVQKNTDAMGASVVSQVQKNTDLMGASVVKQVRELIEQHVGDVGALVAGVKADINYIHTLSPYSLKAILGAAGRGEIKLTDAQTAAIAGQLSAAAVASIDAALRDDFEGVKARLSQLPAETIAALKAAL